MFRLIFRVSWREKRLKNTAALTKKEGISRGAKVAYKMLVKWSIFTHLFVHEFDFIICLRCFYPTTYFIKCYRATACMIILINGSLEVE